VAIELEIKAADAAEVKGGGAVATEDPMVFTIIGSVTGIRDDVNDIIEPGAYTETLRKRTPKIIKDHDWQQRLGKTLEITELLPGDPRLPKTTSGGAPWPREAGALVSKVRLFNSVAGREAAERWREYGNEQQYSIGYVVPSGKAAKDPKTGVRRIKALELFEISDVLWGAMPLAGPMPGALATKMLPALVAEGDADTEEYVEAKGLALDDIEVDPLDEDAEAGIVEVLLNVKAADLDAIEVKYDTSPVGKPGGRQNWVDKAGGLPAFIRAIAHALIRHGAAEDRAIATAVAACKRWAAGAGKVSAKTRAKAAAAIAEWERKKASAHASKGLMEAVEDTYLGWRPDLDAEAGSKGAPVLQTKGAPRLPGTLEERRDLIVAEVKTVLGATSTVVGTAEDHVIVSRLQMTDGEPTGVEAFKVGYAVRGGLVHLDEPEPVTLDLSTDDGQVTPEDIHLLDAIEDASLAAKALLLPAAIESKAGRVLSGGNTERIKNAVQALIAVLKAAGVDLDPSGDDAPSGAPAAPVAPPAPSTPAPVAVKSLDGLPDPHDLVASLRAAARAE
jgi:phage head maturation protease